MRRLFSLVSFYTGRRDDMLPLPPVSPILYSQKTPAYQWSPPERRFSPSPSDEAGSSRPWGSITWNEETGIAGTSKQSRLRQCKEYSEKQMHEPYLRGPSISRYYYKKCQGVFMRLEKREFV
jgi:hypothetical protein